MTLRKIGKLETAGMYSLLLRANPTSMRFELDEANLQQACIGFANGAFFRTALMVRLDGKQDSTGGDVEMAEESKEPQLSEQKRLQEANI